MADAGEQPRLAQQFTKVEILAMRHLDGDALVDPRILREVNRTETTAPERREDLVLPEVLTLKKQC
jgi:hypothetical protein